MEAAEEADDVLMMFCHPVLIQRGIAVLARHKGRVALASLPLEPWTDRRRKDLLNLLAMLDAQLESLNDAVTRVAKEYPGVTLLMSQPDVLGHIGVQNR